MDDDERKEWVHTKRSKGNKLVSEQEYDKAIDAYLEALSGLSFKDEQLIVDNKIPILNNIGHCMIKKGMHERALAILDEVVKLDPSNFKAHIRKARCFIDLT